MKINMRLRRVDDGDAVRFLRWWNDRETRRFSGAGGPVTLDEHLRWFFANIENPNWYVGMVPPPDRVTYSIDGPRLPEPWTPVGACRIKQIESDVQRRHWISIVCDPLERGKGYGTELIRLVTEAYQRDARGREAGFVYPPGCVYARIHHLNAPSVRVFEQAGYAYTGEVTGVWRVYWRD